ncbi:MAG: hypothetical protein GY714_23455 [Desulfobacterales bacterium]|nr:hypothetical protein [Desulfobacterales bacterium]
MAQLIRSMSDLNKFLDTSISPRVKISTQQTAEDIEKMVTDYIMKEFYSYNPSDYHRTYEYINSLVHTKPIKIKDGWKVEIYFDTDRIHASFVEDSGWNQHMSFEQEDISPSIPLWIEEGTPNNPYYQHEGIHSMDYVKSQVAFIKSKVIEHLKKNGLNASVI